MRFAYVTALAAVIACAGTAGADPPVEKAGAKARLSKKPPRTPKSRPAPPDDDAPPWLGIGLDDGTRGVKVIEVMDETPASRVGIRVGDEVLAVDGVALTTRPQDLITLIRSHHGGDRVQLMVARGSRKLRVTAVLETKPDDQELLERRLLDKPAPSFDLPVVGADATRTVALDSLRGKVVVLEFMATWCFPCKSTYKPLSDLHDQRGVDGLVVIGLSEEEDAKLSGLIAQEGIRFPVVRDIGAAAAKAYQRPGTPTFVVIDRGGVVRFVGAGAGLNADHAMFAAERLLDEKN